MGATMRDEWDREAERWIAWVRTPGHDAYWKHHRRQLLGILPTPGRRTLDVGAGEGRVARDLALLGHDVVGVEPSASMATAAATHEDAGPMLRGDAAALPVPDGAVDLVVAFMSLQDIDAFEASFVEIGRVLEPGGRAVVAIVHPINSCGRWGGEARGAPFVIGQGYVARRRTDETFERDGLTIRFASEHRPLVDYSRAIEDAGLVIEALREPTDPDELSRWRDVPLFLHLRLVKPPVGESVGRRIFHITTPADAEQLVATGSLEPPSLVTEGFAHCSTAAQVVATTERWMAHVDDLVLVELDVERLDADVRWPEVYPGQRFPHVHGPLDGDAVVRVHPWHPADRTAWTG
ncbi:MAG: DUF952 domain-containing protein [Actinomycetota bacterium]